MKRTVHTSAPASTNNLYRCMQSRRSHGMGYWLRLLLQPKPRQPQAMS